MSLYTTNVQVSEATPRRTNGRPANFDELAMLLVSLVSPEYFANQPVERALVRGYVCVLRTAEVPPFSGPLSSER